MNRKQIQTFSSGDQALLWRPKRIDGISLFKARFSKFAYKKHYHSGYAIGLIEEGVQKFHHLGQSYTAPAKTIISLNPDEAHDGMSACSAGYQYRMAYISENKIQEIITCHSEMRYRPGYFKRPKVIDHKVAGLLHIAFMLLDEEDHNSLESYTYLIQAVTHLFHRHAGRKPHIGHPLKNRKIVNQAIEFIREKAEENITLEEISSAVNFSQYHFLRIFRNTTGLPPHAYLIQMRVERAKRAIEKGRSLGDAALEAGYSDQSHMTRCFKAIHGLPPGKYKKALFC